MDVDDELGIWRGRNRKLAWGMTRGCVVLKEEYKKEEGLELEEMILERRREIVALEREFEVSEERRKELEGGLVIQLDRTCTSAKLSSGGKPYQYYP